jgi:hypothetical protein
MVTVQGFMVRMARTTRRCDGITPYASLQEYSLLWMLRSRERTTQDPNPFAISLHSRLSGLVVSVLATGPKGRGFKPGRGDGFLRVIKILRTYSFGWEVKPEAPCRKILRHVKEPCVA